ncbi:MAG: diguanylate cyclase [Oscillospiraceae bacterium]|nr:diguanylate cyclase [Oscillospiraceae bacterium]
MPSFSFYYIEGNVLCVIVFGIILLHNHFNIDRRERQVKYDKVLVSFIFYFLTDCVWAGIVDGVLPKGLIYVVSFLIYFFMAATVYTWYEFVMAYLQHPKRENARYRFLVSLPALLSAAAMAVQLFAAPHTLIGENLETLDLYNVYMTLFPDFYMVVILIYTLRRRKKEENPTERKKLLFIGFFPLMVSVGGFVQSAFLPQSTIYCFTCLILMLVFYIDSIETRISLDPLTGLNNRGQLTRYCAQRSNLFIDERLTVVIMMDIDHFKSINDSFGHAEGDNALVVVSDAMRKTVNQSSVPSFLCRYGGDEFILIIHPAEIGEADRMIREIRGEIGRQESAYPLWVSAGYDTLGSADDSIQDCIVRADKKLYEDKERRKHGDMEELSQGFE